jgi:hypothetical protein
MRVTFDADRPVSERIIAMEVAGALLDEAKQYRVAVLDFLARGGDDYVQFRDAARITPDNDAPLLTTEVMIFIERAKTITTGVEGRMKAV